MNPKYEDLPPIFPVTQVSPFPCFVTVKRRIMWISSVIDPINFQYLENFIGQFQQVNFPIEVES